MARCLDTGCWVDQFEAGQPAYKVLMSLPECGDGQVDLNSAIILGLLWCEGGFKDKAEIIFKLLNPPGQQQEIISANDQEWEIVFDRLIYIATHWTEKYAGSDKASVYHNEALVIRAIKMMRLSEEDEPEL